MATESQFDALVEQSSIVFIGQVQRLTATTVPTHLATSHTITVKVGRTLRAPKAIGDLAGQNITVELTVAPGLRVGQERIFFANGLVYGDSIVVQEVGRVEPARPGPQRQAQYDQILAAHQRLPEKQIKRRLQSADVVVTGKVASIRKAPQAPGPISEHDADWHEAVIDVEAVEHGLPMKQVVVLFPRSRDIRWRHAPKFSVGQEGVWILHRHQIQRARTAGYVALDPADFHPKTRRALVRALIRRG
jgi:hypothetical protein